MTGSRSTTSSPSTVNTMRKTPCVAGCCGPTLTLMSIVSRSLSCGSRVSIAMRLLYCHSERRPRLNAASRTIAKESGAGRTSVRGSRVSPEGSALPLLLLREPLECLRHRLPLLLRREPLRPRLLPRLRDQRRLLLRELYLRRPVLRWSGRLRSRRRRSRCRRCLLLLLGELLQRLGHDLSLFFRREALRARLVASLRDQRRLLLRELNLRRPLVHRLCGRRRRSGLRCRVLFVELLDRFLHGRFLILSR